MAIVERPRHLLLFDDQDPTPCHCRSGRCAERLIPHASCTEVASTMQNSEVRLLTPLRLNCDFQLPFLNVEHFLLASTCEQMACPSRNRATKLFAPIFVRNTAGRKARWRLRVITFSKALLLILLGCRFHGQINSTLGLAVYVPF